MNIRNEKRKLRRGLRVLELIDLATEKLEILESNKRMAEATQSTTLYNRMLHEIEIEEAVIERLSNYYINQINK
jgi:hypothetical protein